MPNYKWICHVLAVLSFLWKLPKIYQFKNSTIIIVSFSLTLFYFIKGVQILLAAAPTNQSTAEDDHGRKKGFFARKLKSPILLFAIYGLAVALSQWIVRPFEWFLFFCHPIFTLLEGFCVALIAFCAGKYFMKTAVWFPLICKVFCMIVLFCCLIICLCLIGNIYHAGNVDAATAT